MARRPISIRVNPKDRKRIERLVRAGVQQVRVVVRALALRQLAEGATAPRVAEALPLTAKAIRQIAHRYKSAGLDRALYDEQRPGAKPLLNDSERQRIVAMVCGRCSMWVPRSARPRAPRRRDVANEGLRGGKRR